MTELNKYVEMLESMFEGIYFVDKDRKITFWNKGAEEITGFSQSEMLGSYCYDNKLNHVDEFGTQLCLQGCPLHQTIQDGEMRESVVYLHHKKGHRVQISVRILPLLENGKIVGSIELFSDLSKPKLVDDTIDDIDELRFLANYDQLTKLPNRRYLENFLNNAQSSFKTLQEPYGVIFMDVDNFRVFNNNYGHDIGDAVLEMIAETFRSVGSPRDLIGRWGGEEFVGVIVGANHQKLQNLCEKIRMLIEASTLREHDEALSVTISVGGALVKPDDTVDSVVKRADAMMYLSKEAGKNRVTLDLDK